MTSAPRRRGGLGNLLERSGPPVGDTEHDRVREVPAEDRRRLLEPDLAGLGGLEVLAEAERLRVHRRTGGGLGRHPLAEDPEDQAGDDEPEAQHDPGRDPDAELPGLVDGVGDHAEVEAGDDARADEEEAQGLPPLPLPLRRPAEPAALDDLAVHLADREVQVVWNLYFSLGELHIRPVENSPSSTVAS